MSDYSATIDKLKEALKKQGEQLVGDEDITPFVDTLGDYDDFDSMLDDLFNTEDANSEWVKLKGDEGKSEARDGVRLRLRVAFLSMWKKALIKACSRQTDVDKVFDNDIANINTGLNSLEATKLVLADPESEAE